MGISRNEMPIEVGISHFEMLTLLFSKFFTMVPSKCPLGIMVLRKKKEIHQYLLFFHRGMGQVLLGITIKKRVKKREREREKLISRF
jgi:hypothetical protein